MDFYLYSIAVQGDRDGEVVVRQVAGCAMVSNLAVTMTNDHEPATPPTQEGVTWAVTHAPSGKTVGYHFFRSFEEALAYREEIIPLLDWSGVDPLEEMNEAQLNKFRDKVYRIARKHGGTRFDEEDTEDGE